MNIKRFLPLIGVIILAYLLYRFDFPQVVSVFDMIPNYLFILFLFVSIPVVVISTIEWQYLLKKQDIHVSFLYSIKNIFIGYFFGFIIPGGIGGYTRALYLKDRAERPLEICLFNIGIINTIDIITLFLISIIGAFLFSSIYPFLFYPLLLFCMLWIIFLGIFIHQKTWKWIVSLLFRFTILKPYHQKISTSIPTLEKILPKKSQIIVTGLLSFIGWVLRFSLFYVFLRSFSIEVDYISLILIIAIANIIAMIPISIYGLGTRDAILVSFFSLYSVSSDLVLGVSLFWFFVIWVVPSIIGAIISFFEKNASITNNTISSS
jgi:uncharacterized protein (TIRG00374 family)